MDNPTLRSAIDLNFSLSGIADTKESTDDSNRKHKGINGPILYFLDTGLATSRLSDAYHAGRILVGSTDARPVQPLVSGQRTPDGIDISLSCGKIFWTSMGIPIKNDGAIFSSNLDGSDVKAIIPPGLVHTPKQLAIEHQNSKIYIGDREGLRILRCSFDGSELETLIQCGNWQNEEHKTDQLRWCVGVAVSLCTGKFYGTQKGPPKGGKGQIFQANINFLPGENAENRTDVDVIFQNLPEPADLDIDHAHNMLYWTDRGALPLGNSINRARLAGIEPICDQATSLPGKDYELICRNLHDAIGIKLDPTTRHIYATDLGGAVYQFD